MQLDFSDPRDADLKAAYAYEQDRAATRFQAGGCGGPCGNLAAALTKLRESYALKLEQRRVARPARR